MSLYRNVYYAEISPFLNVPVLEHPCHQNVAECPWGLKGHALNYPRCQNVKWELIPMPEFPQCQNIPILKRPSTETSMFPKCVGMFMRPLRSITETIYGAKTSLAEIEIS